MNGSMLAVCGVPLPVVSAEEFTRTLATVTVTLPAGSVKWKKFNVLPLTVPCTKVLLQNFAGDGQRGA